MGYHVVQGLIHTAYMSEIGTSMHNSQAYASFKSQTHRTILMKQGNFGLKYTGEGRVRCAFF